MKSVTVFDMRDFDEAEWFEKYSQELGLTLSTFAALRGRLFMS